MKAFTLAKRGKKVLRSAVSCFLVASLVLIAGCGAAASSGEDKDSSGTPVSSGEGAPSGDKILKFGSDIAYAPFEFMDEKDNATGFDIELATAVAEDMGYKAEFEAAAFDGLLTSLDSGKYDAVISAMTITEERAQAVLFSEPYFKTLQYIAYKTNAPYKTLEELKGKRVGVQVSTTGMYAAEDAGITPRSYETTPDALNDLINGGVDAVVADAPVVLWFIKQNPGNNIECASAATADEFYGVAFKKTNTELADKFNASLQKLIDNGKYDEIYKKWFNEDPPKLK